MSYRHHPEKRKTIANEILSGELSYRAAARKYGLSTNTLWKWCHPKGAGPKPVILEGKVKLELRLRLVEHVKNGEITMTEAAIIAGVQTSTVRYWIGRTNISKCRDSYLKRLFPDLFRPYHAASKEHDGVSVNV